MTQFNKFNENLYQLLNPTGFQPARFVHNKYGKKYTRNDYNSDKTMGCRGVSFYIFASMTNNINELNESVPKRERLDSYIKKFELISPSKTINKTIDVPNKSVSIVSLFANIFEGYYVPWHTFILIRFDNPTGSNFKILQSWNDEELIISIYELSSNWISNPCDYILSIIENRDAEAWKQLFGYKTCENICFEKVLKYQFNFQLLNDDIDCSWYDMCL
jgi:hypothetical protein